MASGRRGGFSGGMTIVERRVEFNTAEDAGDDGNSTLTPIPTLISPPPSSTQSYGTKPHGKTLDLKDSRSLSHLELARISDVFYIFSP